MRIGVLASGAGTNLQALIDRVHRREGVEIVGVGSDKPGAEALARAGSAGILTRVFPVDMFPDRATRDEAMAEWFAANGVELIVLAGYMQLVSPEFLRRFPDRIINVHPALLPAFPGLGAIEQALAYGVKVMGVTVHFVDEGVDTGRVISQASVAVPHGASAPRMRELLRPLEHDLLCDAVRRIARGTIARDPAHPRRIVVVE